MVQKNIQTIDGLKIFVVDSDNIYSKNLVRYLNETGIKNTLIINSLTDGFNSVMLYEPDITIISMMLNDGSGLDLLKLFKRKKIKTNIIMIDYNCNSSEITDSIYYGAWDFIPKIFSYDKILKSINTCYETKIKPYEKNKNYLNEVLEQIF